MHTGCPLGIGISRNVQVSSDSAGYVYGAASAPPLNLLDIYRFSHSTVILHQSRTESCGSKHPECWESWGMLRSIPCSSILFSFFFFEPCAFWSTSLCGPDRSPSIYNNKSCATVSHYICSSTVGVCEFRLYAV